MSKILYRFHLNAQIGSIVFENDNMLHKGQLIDWFKDDYVDEYDSYDDDGTGDKIGIVKVVDIIKVDNKPKPNKFSLSSLFDKVYNVYCEKI